MQLFAEAARRAALGFVVASLVIFAFWALYHVLEDEWDTASYAGRDYSCSSADAKDAPRPAHRLPGLMNGNPVFVERRPPPGYSPTVVHVRVGRKWRVCGLHGGP